MVNIWALDKHPDLLHVLLLLNEQLGPQAFVVDTQTPQDARAIYLLHPADPGIRIWLNTLGQQNEHYGLHIERLEDAEYDNFESLSLTRLVDQLSVVLEVPVVVPLP